MNDIIYKFYRPNQFLYDALISNHIYFSSIEQFNDPYDSHLVVMNEITINQFESYLDKLEVDPTIKEKYLSAFKKDPKSFTQPFINLYKDWLKYIGICCFSKRKDNVLLWSHYADSHKGICLGFDYSLMKKRFPQFDEVDYNSEPVNFNLSMHNESVSKVALRKSVDWKYEEEIRFFTERKKHENFPREALVEVNFGTRCDLRTMSNIQLLASKIGYPKCKFFRAQINEAKYIVEFNKSDFSILREEVIKDSELRRFSLTINLEHLLK